MEARFQIDLKVSDEAIKGYIPEGFTLSVATEGPAKDCNLRLIFVDRTTVNGPDGKAIGSGNERLVYLAAPVKDKSGATAQLVIGGLASNSGPFENYLVAKTHDMKRTTTTQYEWSCFRFPRLGFRSKLG